VLGKNQQLRIARRVQRPGERLPKLAVTPHAPRGKAEALFSGRLRNTVSPAMSGYIGGTIFMRDGENSLVVQLQVSNERYGGARGSSGNC
jgi:hypothetical protein